MKNQNLNGAKSASLGVFTEIAVFHSIRYPNRQRNVKKPVKYLYLRLNS